jgi:hypothetical protein
LRKIYEKNNSRFSRQLHNPQQSGLLKPDGTLQHLTVSAFLSRFLFVHGLLFYLALNEAHAAAASSPPPTIPKYDSDMTEGKAKELIHDQFPAVMEDFEQLLRLRQVREEVLLHMLTVCLFSLHFSGDNGNDNASGSHSHSQACDLEGEGDALSYPPSSDGRTTKESLSLLILYSMINK